MNALAAFLIELALKGTVVLAAAFAGARLARRLSAAERHVVWALALASLAVLPVLAVCGPGLPLPGERSVAAALDAFSPWAPTREGTRATSSGAPPLDARAATSAIPKGGARTSPASAARSGGARASRAPAARATWPALGPLVAIAEVLYLGVATALLIYLAAGVLRVAVSLRGLPAVGEPRLLDVLEDVRRTQGLNRSIRLRVSPTDPTPWAWGLLRPTVVVPRGFAALPAEAQRAALVHELSHIARFDFVTTLLGTAACALYWAQPLAWLALRRMTRESEHACDDRVLLAGAPQTAYAEQLLDTARAIRRLGRPAAATAMARCSAVALRIGSILSPNSRRSTVSKKYVLCLSILTATFIVPVAALKSQALAGTNASPANDEELAKVVQALVAKGEQDRAADALADYISRDVATPDTAYGWMAAGCRFCSKVLANRDSAASTSAITAKALSTAFDEVEARARRANDGDLLIRLAGICAQSDDPGAIGRGTYYLIEAFRLGRLSGASDFAAIAFLEHKGWDAQAKELAQHWYDDSSSRLYHSKELERLIKTLAAGITQRDDIVKRVLTPDATFAYEDGDAVPLYRQPPSYPPAALKQGLEGSAILDFTISDQGKPIDISVVRATNEAFGKSASEALAHWLYAPKIVDGVAEPMANVKTKMVFQLAPR